MFSKFIYWCINNIYPNQTISYYIYNENTYIVQLNLVGQLEIFESEEDCVDYINIFIKEYPNYKYIGITQHPSITWVQRGFNDF